ncbi:DNA-3-methyladenine glycosylase I [Candidatus Coxiella mudrowiae]|uniref:DNA-3-methyladenine glycosylase I n=1 Tax=Candidatus Coxiella mudrowiae TaxID=2054173 RepID=UPI0027D24D3D|nr:DNA-3-methyladenine glycosylase I [Candidatus Coxiella mudrowiae]
MEEWGNFSDYIWHFISGYSVQNHWQTSKQVPSTSAISHAMLKDFKKRRLKFVGSTIHYAFYASRGNGE